MLGTPSNIYSSAVSSKCAKFGTFVNSVTILKLRDLTISCFGVFINLSAKSCKKCLISSKTTKNHRFGQNLQVFEQTIMFWRFHQLSAKSESSGSNRCCHMSTQNYHMYPNTHLPSSADIPEVHCRRRCDRLRVSRNL